eukprot:TRINITY_DN100689_c0_g1_i1.p1 TRINITY_DN100689_c0_g1~~TRINITY_DN100689_c0_g1_i1.p1  ORF type:complete len:492 (-),score=138.30 TRINITY_DN100689_c0_g1_i1:167-1642(-)
MAELDAVKLFTAVNSKNENLALTYLEHCTQVEQLNQLDAQDRSILVRGIQEELKDFVDKLLKMPQFSAVNSRDAVGRTALHWATIRNNLPTVQALLARQDFTEVNSYDNKPWTALHHAAARGHNDICRFLSNHRRFTEIQGTYGRDSMNALHLAARRGHAEACKVLLENPIVQKSNSLTRKCWTPLHCAAFAGHPDVIEALLTNQYVGVRSIDSKDNQEGWTALHVAAVHGNPKACLALMNGKRFNAHRERDWHSRTPLHLAALRGQAAVCMVLLGHPRFGSEEINAVDKHKRSALHTAVSLEHYQTSLILLTHPRFTARYHIDNSGKTAHDLAEGELLRVWNELLIFESFGDRGKENYKDWLTNGGLERYRQEGAAKGISWRRDALGDVFDLLDEDRSGTVDVQEMLKLGQVRKNNYHRVFAAVKGEWDQEKCMEMIKKMDTSGNGGQVDRLEFVEFFFARLPAADEAFQAAIRQFKDALSPEEEVAAAN